MTSTRSGFHTLTPYIVYRDAGKAIEFYRRALAAEEIGIHRDGDGRIRHAEMRIGDSPMMMAEENAEFPDMKSAESLGNSPIHLFCYVSDADIFMDRAIKAGCTVVNPI